MLLSLGIIPLAQITLTSTPNYKNKAKPKVFIFPSQPLGKLLVSIGPRMVFGDFRRSIAKIVSSMPSQYQNIHAMGVWILRIYFDSFQLKLKKKQVQLKCRRSHVR